MRKVMYVLLTAAITLAGVSCNKDDDNSTPSPTAAAVTFHFNYEVDGTALIWDSLMFTNQAGNQYKVERLQYYLSSISLIRSDSSVVTIKDYQYVDASRSDLEMFDVNSVPLGNYIGIQFNIGLDSALNQTAALPNTPENQSMEWPDAMGGGYHFMKFEGHYMSAGNLTGFAMHLGKNDNLVSCTVYHAITVAASGNMVHMTMNLNEWFKNPEVYNFDVDGPSSMGSMMAMGKLMRNGSDVFTLH